MNGYINSKAFLALLIIETVWTIAALTFHETIGGYTTEVAIAIACIITMGYWLFKFVKARLIWGYKTIAEYEVYKDK